MHQRSKIIAGCVALLVIVALLAQARRERKWKAELLMAVPDRIATDSALRAYAQSKGRTLFDEHCAECHGKDLMGNSARGVPNLVDKDWLYGTGRVGEIERVILYGIRSGNSKAQNLADMPAFATPTPYSRYAIEPLTASDVSAVVALIYSFQHPATADAHLVERGASIYHGKGLCFDCHGDHAKGDSAVGAPNLTDAIWLYGDGSQESIRNSVERGLRGVCPEWASRLAPDAIRSIAVYVNSKAQQ